MRIRSEALYRNKMIEGKSSDQANKEVVRDKIYLKDATKYETKILILEKKIRRYEDMINSQKDKIKKLESEKSKNKLVNGLKEYAVKERKNKAVNTYHVLRVINYLKENPNSCVTYIAKAICTDLSRVHGALNFLMKLNLVKESREGRTTYYELIKELK